MLKNRKTSDFRTPPAAQTPAAGEVGNVVEADFETGETVCRPEKDTEAAGRRHKETQLIKNDAISEIERALRRDASRYALHEAIRIAKASTPCENGPVEVEIHFDVIVRKGKWSRTRRYTLTRLHRFTAWADAAPKADWKPRSAKHDVPVRFSVHWDLDTGNRRTSGL